MNNRRCPRCRHDDVAYSQYWANVIRDGSSDAGTMAVIRAVNTVTANRRANQADVIVACAQILAQSIVPSGPDVASEVRDGIIALIDGFAMQAAVSSD